LFLSFDIIKIPFLSILVFTKVNIRKKSTIDIFFRKLDSGTIGKQFPLNDLSVPQNDPFARSETLFPVDRLKLFSLKGLT